MSTIIDSGLRTQDSLCALINSLSKNGYREYLSTWLSGLKSEVAFWYDAFQQDEQTWMSRRGYSPYQFEYDFKFNDFCHSPETYFLDAGSGPVSDCGSRTDKTKLEIRAVDPLAEIYALFKREKGLATKISPEFCCVELLGDKFGENAFDLVHMRNSLDHSFNPILGIAQLLYVTKLNGKVILVHVDDEAERNNYGGLHQWNLNVKEDQFVIWRSDLKINIRETFCAYADVECIPAEPAHNGKIHYHTAILTKKNAIPFFADPNKNLLMEGLMSSLLQCLYFEVKADRRFAARLCRKAKRILRRILG